MAWRRHGLKPLVLGSNAYGNPARKICSRSRGPDYHPDFLRLGGDFGLARVPSFLEPGVRGAF